MPGTWTSEHDAQLFHLTVEQFKVQGKDLVAGWEKRYGKYKAPTASAIDQHVGQLRKKLKVKTPSKPLASLPANDSNGVAGTPTKPTISRSQTPKTPKTPASRSKRKRETDSKAEMSDDDGSDAPLSKEELTEIPIRNTPSRHKTPKRYANDTDYSDAEDTDGADAGPAKKQFMVDKKMGGESDVSDFSPFD